MIIFSKHLIFFFIFSEIYTFLFYSAEQDINHNNVFLLIFILFFFYNFISNKDKNINLNLDIDLVFKYLILILKTPNFLLNYIINILKKIYLYLVHFKYKYIYNTLKIFLRKYLLNFLILWRPLFKKMSYFGYYRSNRSKWIK